MLFSVELDLKVEDDGVKVRRDCFVVGEFGVKVTDVGAE